MAAAPDELLLYGGDIGRAVSGELWSLTAAGDQQQQQLLWQQVAASGMPPPARSGHAACVLPGVTEASGGLMLISGGRAADGFCHSDLFLFSVETRRWSQPRVTGDVPRPRWGGACCALPAGGPHGPQRMLVDGGRDMDGWTNSQMLVDVLCIPVPMTQEGQADNRCYIDASNIAAANAASGMRATTEEAATAFTGGLMGLVLQCHDLTPGGHEQDESTGRKKKAEEDAEPPPPLSAQPPLSGHSATVCGGSVWIVGGSYSNGELRADTKRLQSQVVRWVCPSAGKLGFKSMGGPNGPQLFEELIGPMLLASTHTATRCGDYVYVLGGHEPPSGLLWEKGGGLILSILHVPSLSWKKRNETLHQQAPKIKCGHSAVLLPGASGIAVFGGVHSNVAKGSGATTRMSDELQILKIGKAKKKPQRGQPPEDPKAAITPENAKTTLTEADMGDEPKRWGKAGGGYNIPAFGWPRPRCGHTATALPGPYGEHKHGLHGAMLMLFGYTVDPYTPDGAEGILSSDAYLYRPLKNYWSPLSPSGARPAPRTNHAAALLSAGPALIRVGVFGGWGQQQLRREQQSEENTARIATARYLGDLHILTLDALVEGVCSRDLLKPPGGPPSPRAGVAAVGTADGGILLFGGHDDRGGVSGDALELCALPGSAVRQLAAEHADSEGFTGFGMADDGPPPPLPATADILRPSTVSSGDLRWVWPEYSGDYAPGAARLSAEPLGDQILVLIPPPPNERGSGAERGANGEPGAAVYVMAGDGWTDEQLNAKYRRTRTTGVMAAKTPPPPPMPTPPTTTNKPAPTPAITTTTPRVPTSTAPVITQARMPVEQPITVRPPTGPKISFFSATDRELIPFYVQRAGSSSAATDRKIAKLADDKSGDAIWLASPAAAPPTAESMARRKGAAPPRPFMSTSPRMRVVTHDSLATPSPGQYAPEVTPPMQTTAQARAARDREEALKRVRVFLLPQAKLSARDPGAPSTPAYGKHTARRAKNVESVRPPLIIDDTADMVPHREDLRPPPYFAVTRANTPGPGTYPQPPFVAAQAAATLPTASVRSTSPRLRPSLPPTSFEVTGTDVLPAEKQAHLKEWRLELCKQRLQLQARPKTEGGNPSGGTRRRTHLDELATPRSLQPTPSVERQPAPPPEPKAAPTRRPVPPTEPRPSTTPLSSCRAVASTAGRTAPGGSAAFAQQAPPRTPRSEASSREHALALAQALQGKPTTAARSGPTESYFMRANRGNNWQGGAMPDGRRPKDDARASASNGQGRERTLRRSQRRRVSADLDLAQGRGRSRLRLVGWRPRLELRQCSERMALAECGGAAS